MHTQPVLRDIDTQQAKGLSWHTLATVEAPRVFAIEVIAGKVTSSLASIACAKQDAPSVSHSTSRTSSQPTRLSPLCN